MSRIYHDSPSYDELEAACSDFAAGEAAAWRWAYALALLAAALAVALTLVASGAVAL